MMVAWPQNHVKLQQILASIDSKYCTDLVAAKALASRPPAIHDTPEMLVIADADKKPKAGKATKEVDEPMRSAPITLSADGDANGFPAACPPEPSVATQEAETAAQAPAAQKTQQAYDVLVAGTTSLAPPPIESYGDKNCYSSWVSSTSYPLMFKRVATSQKPSRCRVCRRRSP